MILKEKSLTFNINSIIKFFYFLLLGLIILLPSGEVFGINFKNITFIIILFFLIIKFFLQKKFKYNLFILTSFILFVILLFWVIIGINNNYKDAFNEYFNFLSVILIIVLTNFIILNRVASSKEIIKISIVFNFLYNFVKICFGFLIIAGKINFADFNDIIIRVFNYQIMSLPFNAFNYHFIRLYAINDAISVLSLITFLIYEDKYKLNKFLSLFYIVIALFSIALSYSRYLYISSFTLFFLYSILLKKENKRLIIIALLIILLFSSIFLNRFNDKQNYISDNIRYEQLNILLYEINNNLLMGKGLGAYSNELIRSKLQPYSYELQLISFMMQLGLIGFSIFIIALLNIIFYIILYKNIHFREKLYLILSYIIWIFSSLFNPYIISSVSGLIISIHLILLDFWKRVDINENSN